MLGLVPSGDAVAVQHNKTTGVIAGDLFVKHLHPLVKKQKGRYFVKKGTKYQATRAWYFAPVLAKYRPSAPWPAGWCVPSVSARTASVSR
jgi:hypothetical protein